MITNSTDIFLGQNWYSALLQVEVGKIMSTFAAAVSVGKNRQGRSAFTTTVVRTGLII